MARSPCNIIIFKGLLYSSYKMVNNYCNYYSNNAPNGDLDAESERQDQDTQIKCKRTSQSELLTEVEPLESGYIFCHIGQETSDHNTGKYQQE